MMATSMITEDELVQEFEDFDVELSDPDVVEKRKYAESALYNYKKYNNTTTH